MLCKHPCITTASLFRGLLGVGIDGIPQQHLIWCFVLHFWYYLYLFLYFVSILLCQYTSLSPSPLFFCVYPSTFLLFSPLNHVFYLPSPQIKTRNLFSGFAYMLCTFRAIRSHLPTSADLRDEITRWELHRSSYLSLTLVSSNDWRRER